MKKQDYRLLKFFNKLFYKIKLKKVIKIVW